jgi:hypothetical protein
MDTDNGTNSKLKIQNLKFIASRPFTLFTRGAENTEEETTINLCFFGLTISLKIYSASSAARESASERA